MLCSSRSRSKFDLARARALVTRNNKLWGGRTMMHNASLNTTRPQSLQGSLSLSISVSFASAAAFRARIAAKKAYVSLIETSSAHNATITTVRSVIFLKTNQDQAAIKLTKFRQTEISLLSEQFMHPLQFLQRKVPIPACCV